MQKVLNKVYFIKITVIPGLWGGCCNTTVTFRRLSNRKRWFSSTFLQGCNMNKYENRRNPSCDSDLTASEET